MTPSFTEHVKIDLCKNLQASFSRQGNVITDDLMLIQTDPDDISLTDNILLHDENEVRALHTFLTHYLEAYRYGH